MFAKLKTFGITIFICAGSINAINFSHAHTVNDENPPLNELKQGGDSWVSHMGYTHGEVAVTKDGNILVSTEVQGSGLLLFSPDGELIRAIANAPSDFHGFIVREEEGVEYIYGTRRYGQSIIKMTLSGQRVMEVIATRIPAEFYNKDPRWNEINLTGIAVANNGEIFVVDGYGMDYIHKFNAEGKYLETFAGKNEPYSFANCHKIFIDPRYSPERLMCTDRYHKRIVHMKMDGSIIGDYANELRRPSAVAFWQDYAAIAEISGRVSLIDKAGELVGVLSLNDVESEINTHQTPPEKWRKDTVTSPHGIIFDAEGNLYVTEWNLYGRVLKFSREAVASALSN